MGAGVFWYETDGKYRQISKEQGLSSALVDSLCLDNQGNLWVAPMVTGWLESKEKSLTRRT